MAHIKIKRGLNIPIAGGIEGNQVDVLSPSKLVALDLSSFEIRFHLLVKEGDLVSIGQALAQDRETEGRMFVSPAGGTIKEIVRGLKRKILYIVIERSGEEKFFEHGALNKPSGSKEEIIEKLMRGGIFSKIRRRPCNVLANPKIPPQSIFVSAVASAPFAVDPSLEVQGYETEFQMGLLALSKLAPVHLVYSKLCQTKSFLEAESVQRHTIEGPHPIGNPSIHIYHIDPILSSNRCVWTLNVHDVISIGMLCKEGKTHHTKVISVVGEAIKPEKRAYLRVRDGNHIQEILQDRVVEGKIRIISGDPLMGKKINPEEFVGFSHFNVLALFENEIRQAFHFFRLGRKKFSATRAYLSGFFPKKSYQFTTNQHGEERAFVDGSVYEKVMPMRIPTMHLIKALLAEDFDLAVELGLLEVSEEDFSLPSFICPSKIEMVEIVKNGLQKYAELYLK